MVTNAFERESCLTSNRSNMADEHDMENQWIIALAGSGTSKRDEFLIINRGNKMFLTCSGEYNRTDCKTILSP